jgi:CRP-like cAMP-binding protein
MGGSVFGEMGMMTGEARRATVIAKSDVDCYRLDKAGFESILRARPDVANGISQVLASRETELESATESVASGAVPRHGREQILRRIRDFFGLEAA